MSEESDDVAWARAHRACFRVGPLVELRGKEKVQVGFTLDLYAELPMDKGPGAERREESHRIWERLRAIVQSLAPAEGSGARMEIEPERIAAYIRTENEMRPEIALQARVSHGGDYLTATTAEERDRLSAVERKLVALGLRTGKW
jgi:hypothetical protein